MTFDQYLGTAHKNPVVAMFYGAACAPCTRLKPVLREVCEKQGLQLEEFNSANEMDAIRQIGLRSVPAVFVIRNGQYELAFSGFLHKEAIVARLAAMGVKVI